MKLLENAYIYGIEINNELVYVGKTYQPLIDRIEEHILRCHNAELEDAMLHHHYNFKIMYESHNLITSEILNTIEAAFIAELQPKYNKCGVTMPYNSFQQKIFSGGGIASQLMLKHYYTLEEIEQLLLQNMNIAKVYILTKEYYTSDFFSERFYCMPKAQQDSVILHMFGKLNKFNEMTNYGSIGFRQKSYCVKEPDGAVRFPTLEEKLQGIPKEKIKNCHIVFFFNEEQDYKKLQDMADQDYLKIQQIENQDIKFNALIEHDFNKQKIIEALENTRNQTHKYYPLKIIPFVDNLDSTYGYVDTWYEENYCKDK